MKSRPLYHPVKIGPITIPGNLFAAPMAGYTDRITRALALQGGADLAWSEMISAEALVRGSERTLAMTRRADGEKRLALQLFGSDPDRLGRAADIAKDLGADLLDLNAGCPVPKVVRSGAGAALSRDPRRLAACIAAMAASGLPVTVKLRSGWDDGERNWRKTGPAAVESGAAAVGFHPRTRSQGYGGRSNRIELEGMVRLLPVPVIGSGDIMTPADAEEMLETTGCAGVMVARGALGDPGIYGRMRRRLIGEEGDSQAPPGRQERMAAALSHLEAAAACFGEERAAREMKKHLAGYARGWESAAGFRRILMTAPDYAELIRILREEAERKG